VWIDGEKVGVWRINKNSDIVVERPANVSRKFVLLKEGTSGAIDAGIRTGDHSNGLIKVEYKPEKRKRYGNIKERKFGYWFGFDDDAPLTNLSYGKELASSKLMRESGCSLTNCLSAEYSSAGTGLGNYSDQTFNSTAPIVDVDRDLITVIHTRLIVDDRKMQYPTYGSLKKNITDIPPPLATINKPDFMFVKPMDHPPMFP
jgi:hypothetical protein